MTTFIPRAAWGARAPKGRTADTSYRGIAVHWEGPRMGWPWDHAKCAAKVRGIQNFHMNSRGWSDIAYNFVACGHDYVFEGRGWDTRSAANGDGERNSTWLAVCYLGGEGDGFPEGGRRAVRWVLDEARRHGHQEWITHRTVRQTACPGDEIHNWVFAGAPVQTRSEDDLTDEQARMLADIYRRQSATDAAKDPRGNPLDNHWAIGYTLGRVYSIDRKVDAITAKVDQLEAAGATGGLSDADVARVAQAVIDELSKRAAA